MRRKRYISGLCAALCVVGCAQPSRDPAPVARPVTVVQAQPTPSSFFNMPRGIDVAFLQFLIPEGKISGSAEFWSHIQEPVVDEDENDQLNRNGIRVGEAAISSWKDIAPILNKAGGSVVSGHFISATTEDHEIPVSGDLPEETLFYFDDHGLSGSFYDRCQNYLAFSYGPTPMQSNCVRLELTPLVRGTRKHYEFTALGDPQGIRYVSSDHLYNLGLRVDLPEGKFLVIAPSSQAERTTSIGHQFLTHDANASRRETVMVFVVTRPMPVPPASATQPAK
jgi:hypothetical protein